MKKAQKKRKSKVKKIHSLSIMISDIALQSARLPASELVAQSFLNYISKEKDKEVKTLLMIALLVFYFMDRLEQNKIPEAQRFAGKVFDELGIQAIREKEFCGDGNVKYTMKVVEFVK